MMEHLNEQIGKKVFVTTKDRKIETKTLLGFDEIGLVLGEPAGNSMIVMIPWGHIAKVTFV